MRPRNFGHARKGGTRRVRVIKLTQTREITPYLWVHPDEKRGAPPRFTPGGFFVRRNCHKQICVIDRLLAALCSAISLRASFSSALAQILRRSTNTIHRDWLTSLITYSVIVGARPVVS